MIMKILAGLAMAAVAHTSPYHLSGPVRLYPHRTVYETVQVSGIPRAAHGVTVHAESADGQDSVFAPAKYSRGHWIARLPFVNSDETGTWSIVSTVWSYHGDHQIGASAHFTVNRSGFVR